MPSLALEIPETYINITRPIVMQLAKDLAQRMELPNGIDIEFLGYAEYRYQNGSLLEKKQDAVFGQAPRFKVDFTEEYLEESVLTTAVKKTDHLAVFYDRRLPVSIAPIYTRTRITLNCQVRADSRPKIDRWRDVLRHKASENKQAPLHEVIYHYALPRVFYPILREIHTKRESVCGYNESFEHWLVNHATHRYTQISNLSGDQSLPVIAEKQIGIQGWFDFLGQPDDADKSNEGETWTYSFNYILEYDKVTAALMKYPIVVHNQLLDIKYINTDKIYSPYDQPRRRSLHSEGFDTFSSLNYPIKPDIPYVRLPEYDDWTFEGAPYKTLPILSTLIGVDLERPTYLVNLQALGEVKIGQDILDFILKYKEDIPYYLKSAFHIVFYKGSIAQDPETIYLDDELTLWSTTALDPREVHHLTLSIVYDLANLHHIGTRALREHPGICMKVIDVADTTTRAGVTLPKRDYYDRT